MTMIYHWNHKLNGHYHQYHYGGFQPGMIYHKNLNLTMHKYDKDLSSMITNISNILSNAIFKEPMYKLFWRFYISVPRNSIWLSDE